MTYHDLYKEVEAEVWTKQLKGKYEKRIIWTEIGKGKRNSKLLSMIPETARERKYIRYE